MRKLIGLLIVGALLSVGKLVHADTFLDGFVAYNRGDYATALKLFRPMAEQGDAGAQSYLGEMYYDGRGVLQDYKEAVRWYRLSADQGDAGAQIRLGWMYRVGRGVPQDYREAVRWFRLSAEQGYAPAQVELGESYYDGRGVLKDYGEALKWWRLAIELSDAQHNLGVMYGEGLGVAQDYVRAHMWLNLAGSKATSDTGKGSRDRRDVLARQMTPAQIAQAQEMARKCQQSNFKDCGW